MLRFLLKASPNVYKLQLCWKLLVWLWKLTEFLINTKQICFCWPKRKEYPCQWIIQKTPKLYDNISTWRVHKMRVSIISQQFCPFRSIWKMCYNNNTAWGLKYRHRPPANCLCAMPYVDHKGPTMMEGGRGNSWYASMKTNFQQRGKNLFDVSRQGLAWLFLFSQLPANILTDSHTHTRTVSYPSFPLYSSASFRFSLSCFGLSQLSALGIFMHISHLSFDQTVYTSWQIKQLASVKEESGRGQTPTLPAARRNLCQARMMANVLGNVGRRCWQEIQSGNLFKQMSKIVAKATERERERKPVNRKKEIQSKWQDSVGIVWTRRILYQVEWVALKHAEFSIIN